MFCANCGNEVGEGAAVCTRCGAQLPVGTEQPGAAYGTPAVTPDPGAGYGPPAVTPDPGGAAQTAAWEAPAEYQAGGATPAAPAPSSYAPAGAAGAHATPGAPEAGYRPPGAPGGAAPGWPAGPAAGSPAFSFDAKRWTGADMIVGVASLVVLISLFLPWFTASLGPLGSGSESGTSAHGWLWIVFIVVLLILGYLVLTAGFARPPFTLPLRHELLLLAATALNVLLVLIAFVDKPSAFGIRIGWGAGAILALIAAIVAVVPLVPAARTPGSGAGRP